MGATRGNSGHLGPQLGLSSLPLTPWEWVASTIPVPSSPTMTTATPCLLLALALMGLPALPALSSERNLQGGQAKMVLSLVGGGREAVSKDRAELRVASGSTYVHVISHPRMSLWANYITLKSKTFETFGTRRSASDLSSTYPNDCQLPPDTRTQLQPGPKPTLLTVPYYPKTTLLLVANHRLSICLVTAAMTKCASATVACEHCQALPTPWRMRAVCPLLQSMLTHTLWSLSLKSSSIRPLETTALSL